MFFNHLDFYNKSKKNYYIKYYKFQFIKFFLHNNKINHLYIIDHFNKMGYYYKNLFFSKKAGVINYYTKKEILSSLYYKKHYNNIFFFEKFNFSPNNNIPTSEWNNKFSNISLGFTIKK